jgi:sugar/nucleoside kinase (ribokinase family)
MARKDMDFEVLRESLVRKLLAAKVDFDVVTMPDFFLDHSLTYKDDAKFLMTRVFSVASRGGGEIHDMPQSLDVGGNAAICTFALASMGARVHPVVRTDRLGFLLMKYFYERLGVDLAHVKTNGNLSPTTILELEHRRRMVNVMLGDFSKVSDLGFDDLGSEDFEIMSHADCVCVFDWVYNKKGTELAEKVFTYCKSNSHARTFFDPSDPRPRLKELPSMATKVVRGELLDNFSVNENEAVAFAGLFDQKLKRARGRDMSALALEAGRAISSHTGVHVYLHTADYSSSIKPDEIAVVPSFDVPVRRATGGGDYWNAGNIVGESLNLTEAEKLLLANAVAARYISSPTRAHSSLKDVAQFLHNTTHKLKKLAKGLK